MELNKPQVQALFHLSQSLPRETMFEVTSRDNYGVVQIVATPGGLHELPVEGGWEWIETSPADTADSAPDDPEEE